MERPREQKELIATELDRIPEEMLDEVLDFVRFLGAKAVIRAGEAGLLREASLAETWLKPGEDAAWSYLGRAT